MDLPVESLYCPRLSCDVFDYVCRGLSQPKVGTFTIDIGSIMQEQAESKKALLKRADGLLRKL